MNCKYDHTLLCKNKKTIIAFLVLMRDRQFCCIESCRSLPEALEPHIDCVSCPTQSRLRMPNGSEARVCHCLFQLICRSVDIHAFARAQKHVELDSNDPNSLLHHVSSEHISAHQTLISAVNHALRELALQTSSPVNFIGGLLLRIALLVPRPSSLLMSSASPSTAE